MSINNTNDEMNNEDNIKDQDNIETNSDEKNSNGDEKFNKIINDFNIMEDNYKKEIQKLKEEVEKSIKTAAHFQNMYKEDQNKFIKNLESQKNRLTNDFCNHCLKIIDMFELSLKSINTGDNKNIIDGIKMIYNYMIQTLENAYDLKKIPCNIGDKFNYDIHDAQQEINTDDESQDNTIGELITNGYTVKGVILRNPVVKVFIYKK